LFVADAIADDVADNAFKWGPLHEALIRLHYAFALNVTQGRGATFLSLLMTLLMTLLMMLLMTLLMTLLASYRSWHC
jgi:hypothetical protein